MSTQTTQSVLTAHVIGNHLYALLSDQGSAMSQSALCGTHLRQQTVREQILAHAPSDHDGGSFVDCTENEELECAWCGYVPA